MINRWLVSCLISIALYAGPVRADQSATGVMQVWKSPSCGCCVGWAEHMDRAGFTVKSHDVAVGILARIKRQAGIAPDYQSCHTAKIGGYVIEGHVPAADVKRLLTEKPEAIGLVVPGMPLGSPGMDFGPEKEPYEVLLVKKDGSTEVFARH